MDRDDRWSELTSGYGDTFDSRPILKLLEHDNAGVGLGWDGWDLLWENLHHQGRVGTASYAAVPKIVGLIAKAPSPNHKAYSLLARIEACRLAEKNPPVPSWLVADYKKAWEAIVEPASRHLSASSDDLLASSIRKTLAYALQMSSTTRL